MLIVFVWLKSLLSKIASDSLTLEGYSGFIADFNMLTIDNLMYHLVSLIALQSSKAVTLIGKTGIKILGGVCLDDVGQAINQ